VAIKDTGIGIREQDKDKLFKLFGFIEETEQLNSNGIGLGLVISEMITKRFGGRIWFESEVNVGTTFTF